MTAASGTERHSSAGSLDLRRIDVLADLGQEFAQSIDIETTLQNVVQRIARHMGAEAASVFLIDGEAQQLECRACFGPVNITGLKLAPGQGIVGRAASENRSQLVADVSADPDFAGTVDSGTGFKTVSTACTPLKSSDGVIGVLQVLNKHAGGHFDESDCEILRLLAAPTVLAINNARMASDLLEQKQLQQELFLARRLQRSLLPKRSEGEFPLLGVNISARQVSGDFYDYFSLDDGRIGFTIGDVSGKGMNAALLMVRATSLLRWVGKSGVSPGCWLAEVNNELLEAVSDGMFVCAVAGYYDPSSGQAVWANAGFPAPLLRTGPQQYQSFKAAAPPLAILEQQEIAEERVSLRNTSIYFYSDGVSEARHGNGEMLADDGFKDLIERFADRPANPRMAGIVAGLRNMDLCDDTTVLMIEGAA